MTGEISANIKDVLSTLQSPVVPSKLQALVKELGRKFTDFVAAEDICLADDVSVISSTGEGAAEIGSLWRLFYRCTADPDIPLGSKTSFCEGDDAPFSSTIELATMQPLLGVSATAPRHLYACLINLEGAGLDADCPLQVLQRDAIGLEVAARMGDSLLVVPIARITYFPSRLVEVLHELSVACTKEACCLGGRSDDIEASLWSRVHSETRHPLCLRVLHPSLSAGTVFSTSSLSASKQLRVGIVGTANIARKTWAAIHDAGHAVVAVGSRDVAKATSFIAECQSVKPFSQVPRAFGSYAQVVELETVDAVYVPLPTSLHLEIVLDALSRRKHVVCEKPVATTLMDVKAMIKAAEANKVGLFDGTMLTHGRRIARIRRVLANTDDNVEAPKSTTDSIGKVQTITAVFTFNGGQEFEKSNIRCNPALDALGCVGDIAWYCVRFVIDAFGGKLTLAEARGETTHELNTVPQSFRGDVRFRQTDGRQDQDELVLSFYCSFREAHQQLISFRGDLGTLVVDDFCLPFLNDDLEPAFTVNHHTIETIGCSVRHTKHSAVTYSTGESSKFQEAQLWRNVFNLTKGASQEQECDPGEVSDWAQRGLEAMRYRTLLTQQVLATCLASDASHRGAWTRPCE